MASLSCGRRLSVRRIGIILAVAVGLLPGWSGRAQAAGPAGHVSGVVRNFAGEPQPDADVVLVDGSGATVATDTAGSGGRYSVAVAPGRYDVGVVTRSPVARVARVRGVEVAPDTHLDIVVLAPEVTLSGTVRDGTGAPLGPDVSVHVGWRWVPTDRDGHYSITVPAGPTSLSVSMSGAGSGQYFSASVGSFDLVTDRALDLTLGFTTLKAKVVDQRDTPLANAWVWSRSADDCPSGCRAGFDLFPGAGRTIATSSAGGLTDADGVVTITTLQVDQQVTAEGPAAGLQPPTPKRLSWPWSGTVRLVRPDAPQPPLPPGAPAPTVTWTGVLRHNGDPVEGSVGGFDTDPDGRFTVRLPAGRHSLDISADIGFSDDCDSGGCSPATNITVPDVDLTTDRTMDIDIPTTRLAVHVLDQQGNPTGADVAGDTGWDQVSAVEVFPGGVGQGHIFDHTSTDRTGNADLLIFPGAAPPTVSASQNGSLRGTASVAPSATSVTVKFSAVVVSGTIRDARGPLPLANWPWVSFTGSYGRYEEFDGDDIHPDGSYRVQAMPGRHTLLITDEPQFDEDDTDNHVATATLPRVWTVSVDLDLARSTALDLTIPDAAPARFRAVDTDGQPLSAVFSMQSEQTIDVAPGLTATARAETETLNATGQFEHMLFGPAKDVSGGIRLPTGEWDAPSWGFTLPSLQPGDDMVLARGATYRGGPIVPVAPTTPTTTPSAPTTTTPAPSHDPGPGAGTATAPSARSGYWALSTDGRVYPFGDAPRLGDATGGAIDLEPTPTAKGYWTLSLSGRVQTFGDATALGGVDVAKLAKGEQPASLSATPSGNGYWVFTNRGRAIPFGDAPFLGDMSAEKLNGPVLGSVATPSGKGYYMVASDGGIFAFGDAAFAGSMGGRELNAPVRSLVPDSDGRGYWLVASDGGIFAFDAPFRGSMGGKALNKPISGMVRYGDGYLMVGADGGIFNFSSSPFSGSLGDKPPGSPVVALAAMP